jgi:iron complex transport system substrate-binding protein
MTLVAAACGSDDQVADQVTTDDTVAEAAAPTSAADEALPAASVPAESESTDDAPDDIAQRIVSLSPTHTETLFAIGAGDLLVAVDDFSNFPAEALELPNELSGFEPNIEAIASFEPDLVLLSSDGAGEQLEALGIETWVGTAATSFDEVYTQIEQLGAVTGQIGGAAELVSSMQVRIDALVAAAPPSDVPLTYFHELDPTLFSVTSDTFIGQQYELLGLTNIAGSSADNGASQYPQLNAEVIIEASPDLIFLADTKCCGETAATVGERAGWGDIAAVRNGNVIEMDDDIASRWGPRIVDYMEAVAAAIEAASVPA